MIAIINYGLGNLRSVAGAIEKIGYEAVITNEPEVLKKAEKLIFPGVGAFGDGMKNLKALNLDLILTDLVKKSKKPILGICLGFQLMTEESYEFGYNKGLGWVDATVKPIETHNGLRVPHVGWNDLFHNGNPLFDGIPDDALFYYVHSYHVDCKDENIVIGECDYGIRFPAAIAMANIYGTQFHPEKSQFWGLRILENFLNMN